MLACGSTLLVLIITSSLKNTSLISASSSSDPLRHHLKGWRRRQMASSGTGTAGTVNLTPSALVARRRVQACCTWCSGGRTNFWWRPQWRTHPRPRRPPPPHIWAAVHFNLLQSKVASTLCDQPVAADYLRLSRCPLYIKMLWHTGLPARPVDDYEPNS